jgi:hypothetical protein
MMDPQRIADTEPMSLRTEYRRRAARGETRHCVHWPFNEAFFLDWSDDLAWLIGLIWSDGCLRGNQVSINSKDRALIETVAALIDAPQRVIPHSTPGCWRINFASPQVSGFLRSIGLFERKSLTIAWPLLPPEYEIPFLRGIIDGDGMVRLALKRPGQQVADLRVCIYTASPVFRDALVALLGRHQIRVGVTSSIAGRLRPMHLLTVIEQPSLRCLYHHLYPRLDVPCLARKRDPFTQWMATPRARSGRKCQSP